MIVTFAPKPGYKAQTKGGEVIQKLQGTAWIDAEDRELVRLETHLVDTLGVGPAKVRRLQPGSNGYFQRRKVNNKILAPRRPLPRDSRAPPGSCSSSAAASIFLEYGDYEVLRRHGRRGRLPENPGN